jgi:hypothetical protein
LHIEWWWLGRRLRFLTVAPLPLIIPCDWD